MPPGVRRFALPACLIAVLAAARLDLVPAPVVLARIAGLGAGRLAAAACRVFRLGAPRLGPLGPRVTALRALGLGRRPGRAGAGLRAGAGGAGAGRRRPRWLVGLGRQGQAYAGGVVHRVGDAPGEGGRGGEATEEAEGSGSRRRGQLGRPQRGTAPGRTPLGLGPGHGDGHGGQRLLPTQGVACGEAPSSRAQQRGHPAVGLGEGGLVDRARQDLIGGAPIYAPHAAHQPGNRASGHRRYT